MGSASWSMRETVPLPYPMCVAWLALLLCALCCFPCPTQALWCRATSHSSQPFPTALPSGQPWRTHVRPGPGSASAQGSKCTACWQRLVWWPLSKLCIFSGGFAHLPRLPSARGFCVASGTAAHLPRERPERLLCSLFAILNITLCFSLICFVWDSCGGTCLGEEGPI